MQKYDLGAIPVVDDKKKLLGWITIDDIVDLIKEEAEKDYLLAAGITQDVDVDDSIYKLSWARLPWLFLGLLGGIGAAAVMGGFEEVLPDYKIFERMGWLPLRSQLNKIQHQSFLPIGQTAAAVQNQQNGTLSLNRQFE